jgi:hypothetical protein
LALPVQILLCRADEPDAAVDGERSGAVSPLFFSKHPAGHPAVCEAKA